MIKRRFYKQDHGDKSGSSDSSSSDEDSAPELEAEDQVEVDEHEEKEKGGGDKALCYPSPGSGYESEDSSNNQDENDASGLLTNEEKSDGEDVDHNKDSKTINKVPYHKNETIPELAEITIDPNDPIQAEISNFILKCKSIFKCRLCPRILCLNETTLRVHLTSKRHARSKKLLGEGRLKLMLNSDGEIEEEQETHAERHARTLALAQESAVVKKKKATGRQRQSLRRKKRMRSCSNKENSGVSVENAVKKKRRSTD